MMKIKLPYWLLLSGLLALRAVCLNAQDSWSEARELLDAGQYREASLSYEYIGFIASDENEKARALMLKAYCYQLAGELKEAGHTFDRIDEQTLSGTTLHNVYREKLRHFIITGDLRRADFMIYQWKELLNDTIPPDDLLFLEMLALMKKGSWLEARSVFEKYVIKNNLPREEMEKFNFLKRKRFLKNEKTAGILSLIIPGSGQVYAGKPLKGLISLTLVSASAFYLINSITTEYYITSASAGLSLFTRFYFGGKNYAQKIVHEKNEKKINDVAGPILLNFKQETRLFEKEFYFR